MSTQKKIIKSVMKRKHFTEIQIKNITWMCFAKNGSISFKWMEFQIWAAKTITKKWKFMQDFGIMCLWFFKRSCVDSWGYLQATLGNEEDSVRWSYASQYIFIFFFLILNFKCRSLLGKEFLPLIHFYFFLWNIWEKLNIWFCWWLRR